MLLLKVMQMQQGKMINDAIDGDTRIKWNKVFKNGLVKFVDDSL